MSSIFILLRLISVRNPLTCHSTPDRWNFASFVWFICTYIKEPSNSRLYRTIFLWGLIYTSITTGFWCHVSEYFRWGGAWWFGKVRKQTVELHERMRCGNWLERSSLIKLKSLESCFQIKSFPLEDAKTVASSSQSKRQSFIWTANIKTFTCCCLLPAACLMES